MPLSEAALQLVHSMENMDHQPDVTEYRKLQLQLFEQLKLDMELHGESSGNAQWLISDLVNAFTSFLSIKYIICSDVSPRS